MKTLVRQGLVCVLCYGAVLTACLAQMDTFLISARKPGGNDCPAYISSVGERVAVRGDVVYVADGYAGLGVYELSAPEHARLLGSYRTGGFARSVRLDGQYARVWDSVTGNVTFDVSVPERLLSVPSAELPQSSAVGPFRRQNLNGGESTSVVAAIVENRLLIARDDLGVVTIDLHGPSDESPLPARPSVDNFKVVPSALPVSQTVRVTSIQVQDPISELPIAVDPLSVSSSVVEDRVVLTRPAAPLRINVTLGLDALTIHVHGMSGQTVRVQRTRNLLDEWEDWATMTLDDAPAELADPDGAAADRMFYRAVAP